MTPKEFFSRVANGKADIFRIIEKYPHLQRLFPGEIKI